jgi:hypothetical protein
MQARQFRDLGDTMTETEQREQLVRIDAALADIALKQEQLRQMKAYEPWKLFATVLTTVAVASGVFGGGIGWTLAHWPL